MFDLRRREFITLLGGAAVTLPVAARAQQAGMPVLGFLGSASQASYTATQAAVHKGLNEAGYVEKQNLLVEYRWANFQYERLPALATELARRPVDAIFATGSVTVAADGFEWQGRTYASLSAIARAITGTAWSGPRFFALRLNGVPARTNNKKSVRGSRNGSHGARALNGASVSLQPVSQT